VDTLTTPSYRFIVFDQDHDQVGNRATGDRLSATLAGHPHRDGLLRVAAGLVLTSPFTPMLFMGEEWGADTPFQFFTDHTDPFFADAVSTGRRSEFAAHGWDAADVPDPQDKQTFLRSKLDWAQPEREPYESLLSWYRSLIVLRRSRPELTDPRLDQVRVSYDEEARWLVVHRGPLRVAVNLGGSDARLALGPLRPAGPTGMGKPVVLVASDPGISVTQDAIVLPASAFAVLDFS
jgi:maltooligosyltrehalose trehalohydrolase